MVLSPVVPSHEEHLTPSALHLKEYAIGHDEKFSINVDWSILNLHAHGELVGQCRLSDSEMYLCELLFHYYPDYAPMEELLANLKDWNSKTCLQLLNEATKDPKNYHKLTMPIRQAVSTLRKKLLTYSWYVDCVDLTGYQLVKLRQSRQQPQGLIKQERARQQRHVERTLSHEGIYVLPFAAETPQASRASR